MDIKLTASIEEATRKLASRGIVPRTIKMHPKTASRHGIHATHVKTEAAGLISVLYNNDVPDDQIVIEGTKTTVDSEIVAMPGVAAPAPKKGK